jgi:hypothetical protein
MSHLNDHIKLCIPVASCQTWEEQKVGEILTAQQKIEPKKPTNSKKQKLGKNKTNFAAP